MLLYNSLGPNPRAMRMFLTEKGLSIPTKEIDILGAENRRAPYTDKNPGGQIPALELDDGSVIAETVVIWEYLEEQNPKPPLIGSNAKERAETRMWQRRIEQRITENLYNGFRFAEGVELFKNRMRVLPDAAAGLKQTAQDNLKWLDGLFANRQYVVPDRFTIADIILYCALDFGLSVGQGLPGDAPKVKGWFDRIAARPSATSSLHPASKQAGLRG
ncbi:MAG: glutathione S-transferase family protein [Candidatus Binatia bacterium]